MRQSQVRSLFRKALLPPAVVVEVAVQEVEARAVAALEVVTPHRLKAQPRRRVNKRLALEAVAGRPREDVVPALLRPTFPRIAEFCSFSSRHPTPSLIWSSGCQRRTGMASSWALGMVDSRVPYRAEPEICPQLFVSDTPQRAPTPATRTRVVPGQSAILKNSSTSPTARRMR